MIMVSKLFFIVKIEMVSIGITMFVAVIKTGLNIDSISIGDDIVFDEICDVL